MLDMQPQGSPALSALGQAQQGASQFAQQQAPAPIGGQNGIGASFEQHAQNPQVQQALTAIGQFLTDIGHPLAGMFSAGQQGGGANAVESLLQNGTPNQLPASITGQAQLPQSQQQQPNPLPQMAGMTAPGMQMSSGAGIGAPGVPQTAGY